MYSVSDGYAKSCKRKQPCPCIRRRDSLSLIIGLTTPEIFSSRRNHKKVILSTGEDNQYTNDQLSFFKGIKIPNSKCGFQSQDQAYKPNCKTNHIRFVFTSIKQSFICWSKSIFQLIQFEFIFMQITAISITNFYMSGDRVRSHHTSVSEQIGTSKPVCFNSQRLFISASFLICIVTDTVKMFIIHLDRIHQFVFQSFFPIHSYLK